VRTNDELLATNVGLLIRLPVVIGCCTVVDKIVAGRCLCFSGVTGVLAN